MQHHETHTALIVAQWTVSHCVALDKNAVVFAGTSDSGDHMVAQLHESDLADTLVSLVRCVLVGMDSPLHLVPRRTRN